MSTPTKAPTAPSAQDEENQQKKLEEERKEKKLLRQANLSSSKQSLPKNLDSNFKRNTSFIKKLQQISEDKKDALYQELQALNLSKYISEVVNAIVEAKLKLSDINIAVKISSLLHQRYPDFTPTLIPALIKSFSSGATAPSSSETEAERNSRIIRRRTQLRFISELFLVGVITDSDILFKQVQELMNYDIFSKDKDREASFMNITLIVSFLRSLGDDLLGLSSGNAKVKKQRPVNSNANDSENSSTSSTFVPIFEDKILSDEQYRQWMALLDGYFSHLAKQLIHLHSDLRAKERENHSLLESKGDFCLRTYSSPRGAHRESNSEL